jgi:hypothetical protein
MNIVLGLLHYAFLALLVLLLLYILVLVRRHLD